MAKRGTYHGGSTIIGWSGVPSSSGKKRRSGPSLLATNKTRAVEPKRSEHMPPLEPAPITRPNPSKTPRERMPVTEAELVHFSFGNRTKDRVLGDLEPIVWKLAENGFRKPADVARLLNNQGVRTACGELWTRQLARLLLDFLYDRRQHRRAAVRSAASRGPVAAPITSDEPLSTEEIIRRLSGLGRIARSD